jgi:hypothetical protein
VPPIDPLPDAKRPRTVGRAIGRALDFIGYAIAGVLIVSPVLALVWICLRLFDVSADGAVRILAAIVSAVAVLSGWILLRVTEGNLRSIRNAWKPAALTWPQYEFSQRLLHRVAVLSMVVEAAGIGLSIPAHL